ncbi:MAG: sigma-70 family RNA polymerase sigma factor [Pseudobdellovibrionaceae bacterium]|nr:sigma-70 family RNA polymerase sigma factor [Bdellovibrionales bacterium]USN47396.1 MAG: sigma-70 family RNA polymerase sigma factor [Pseudobdellovibrionaceae bacterium]
MKADHEIIDAVKSGDRAKFSVLVSRHQQAMMRLAVRMTRDWEQAEDIVQESFLKAFQKLNSFEGRSSFKSWLYQITLNTARNKLRRKNFDFIDISDVPLAVGPKVEKGMAQMDTQYMLRSEIEKLPSRQRMALELRIYEDLSFKEVAEIMDCPYDTAKANYRHALLKMRQELEGLDGFKYFSEFLSSSNGNYKGQYAEVD